VCASNESDKQVGAILPGLQIYLLVIRDSLGASAPGLFLVAPEALEPIRRECRVAGHILDVKNRTTASEEHRRRRAMVAIKLTGYPLYGATALPHRYG
jgi:hypothetical protein